MRGYPSPKFIHLRQCTFISVQDLPNGASLFQPLTISKDNHTQQPWTSINLISSLAEVNSNLSQFFCGTLHAWVLIEQLLAVLRGFTSKVNKSFHEVFDESHKCSQGVGFALLVFTYLEYLKPTHFWVDPVTQNILNLHP